MTKTPSIIFGPVVWPTIQHLNRERRAKAVIIVSYFGTDGAQILPLRAGDEIMVAATDGNVEAGLVNPNELLKYPPGVRVFHVADLHAKLFAFGSILVVGSANVSLTSRDELLEAIAIVRVTSSQLRALLKGIDRVPLDGEELKRLARIYRPPSGFAAALVGESTLPRPRPEPVPEPLGGPVRIWYQGIFKDPDLADQNPLELPYLTMKRIRKGDWYILAFRRGGESYAVEPRRVEECRVIDGWVRLRFASAGKQKMIPAAQVEALAEARGAPIRYKWLLLSDRVPAAEVFKAFGRSMPSA